MTDASHISDSGNGSSNPHSAHLIWSDHGELEQVTTDESVYERAKADGKLLTPNAAAETIARELLPLNASDFMDNVTWQAVADSLKDLADREQQNPAVIYDRSPQPMPPTPPDLPQALISTRATALISSFVPEIDLAPYIELNELSFAHASSRDINLDLFDNESLKCSWHDQFLQTDEYDLEQYLIQIDEMRSENASERAAFGDSAPGSHRQDMLGRLEEKEIIYSLDIKEAQKSSPSPG